MQPNGFGKMTYVLAILLATTATSWAGVDEPFAPKWSAVPPESPSATYPEPAAENFSAQDSHRPPVGELRRLFLAEQPSVQSPPRTPIHQPVPDPGYPRVGNLVQPAQEPSAASEVPAIEAAARIKSDADLSMQKIKAVKYLATVGCECSSQSGKVEDALLAALDDCSEEVRYEGVLALCRSAGNPCSRCNRGGCCSEEVINKLGKMAEGRDQDGCWYEPSGHVRAIARRALGLCGRDRRHRPRPAPSTGPEVAPAPGVAPPPDLGPGRSPGDQVKDPEEPSLEDLAAAAPSSEASSLWATPSPTGTTLGMIGDFLGGTGRSMTVSFPMGGTNMIPIGPTPDGMYSAFQSTDGNTYLTPGAYNDLTMHTDASGDGFADTWALTEVLVGKSSNLLNYQTSNRFPLGPNSVATFNDGQGGVADGDITSPSPDTYAVVSYDATALVSHELPASGIRGLKIAENNSTLPRDRLFFNYSYFRNVMTDGGNSLDVNRFVFGFEKILDEGRTSIETRIPFASTLNSDQRVDGVEFTDIEFGNVGLLLKRILRQGDGYAFGAGLAMSFPTASDTRLFRNDFFGTSNFARPDGTVKIMHLRNDAYHLMPWLGLRLDPNERLFFESFLQVDFGLNENRVYGHFDGPQGRDGVLPSLGRVYDQTVLMADISVGYWLYRNKFRNRKLVGIVPNLELHYASSLQDPDVIWDPNAMLYVNSQLGRFDHLNLTAGTHFVFARGGNITPAVVVPLRSGDDRQFDYELQLQMNVPF